MKLFRFLAGAAVAAAFAFPTHAQFLGFTSPQTITQKIFSGQTTPVRTPTPTLLVCVPTNGSPCGVPNQGQTFHYLTYVPSSAACVIDIAIQASYDGVTFFNISPDATANNILLGQGAAGAGVYANGWFPALAINLTNISNCPGGVSAFYSGTSSSTSNTFGVFTQATALQQTILQNSNISGSTTVVTIATPVNSSGGRIYLTCTVTCGAGTNTFTVFDVPSPPQTQRVLATFTAANTTALQTFTIPALTTNFVQVSFPLGNFATTNASAYYAFDSPGTPAATADVFREINTSTSTQLRIGAGFLWSVVINNNGSSWDFQIFDNTACSGTAIVGGAGIVVVPAGGSTLLYNVNFNTGLCVLTTGATPGSMTVSYR